MNSAHPMDHWATTFKSVDWLIPAYLQMGYLSKCVLAIEQAALPDKVDALRVILSQIYDENHLASMLIGLYSKTIYVKDYKRQIAEAIEASFFGLRHAAVSTLIPVLEGIIRKFAKARGEDVGSGTKGLIEELNHILAREMNSPSRFEERVIMLTVLRDFFSERLLITTKTYGGIDQFNRHGILHGIFDGYGSETNFFRCITILELLCFVTILSHGGSCFAPAVTEDAIVLAIYYRSLKLISVTATPARAPIGP